MSLRFKEFDFSLFVGHRYGLLDGIKDRNSQSTLLSLGLSLPNNSELNKGLTTIIYQNEEISNIQVHYTARNSEPELSVCRTAGRSIDITISCTEAHITNIFNLLSSVSSNSKSYLKLDMSFFGRTLYEHFKDKKPEEMEFGDYDLLDNIIEIIQDGQIGYLGAKGSEELCLVNSFNLVTYSDINNFVLED